MTPRERWLAMLEGKQVDRIPTDYQGTGEVTARLVRDLKCGDEEALWRKLQIDKRKSVEPAWKKATDPHAREAIGGFTWNLPSYPRLGDTDIWGVGYKTADYGLGSYEEPRVHPLAHVETVAQVHAHAWPAPDDFDYSPIAASLEEDDGYWPIHAGYFEPFMYYGFLRGLEKSYEDLVLNPDIADAILGHIFEFCYEHNRRIFEAGRGRIVTTFVAEDLGSQTGPLMSVEMYRRFLMPNQVKMADLARSYGIHIMYHTDGAARSFLPDLVDRVGIEILNPIQWRCVGMEREGLVRDFGGQIIFHGSIDNQKTLPFGAVEDVVGEVRESVEIYRGARWICNPCHNIQPISPTENIVAMYETVNEVVRF